MAGAAAIAAPVAIRPGRPWRSPSTIVTDTAAGMTGPRGGAMQACPTAKSENTSNGHMPPADPGNEAHVAQWSSRTAPYPATCDNRHQTLRKYITDYISEQPTRANL